MATRASEEVTLVSLRDIKTIRFDDELGLIIASEDGANKIIIDANTVNVYADNKAVASFGYHETDDGTTTTKEGFVKLGEPYESETTYGEQYGLEMAAGTYTDDTTGTVKHFGRINAPDDMSIYSDGKVVISGRDGVDIIGGGAAGWTLIKQTVAEETITGLSDAGYKEFLLTCQIDPKGGQGYEHERVMASLTIPAFVFFGYTTDHGNGAHQAYYTSQYNSGASYLGNNKVKLYHPSGCYARLYAR